MTIIERYREEGKEEGLMKGMERGIEKGMEKGIELGESRKKIEVAKNLLKINLPIEQIIDVTGLTKKEMEKLIEESIN